MSEVSEETTRKRGKRDGEEKHSAEGQSEANGEPKRAKTETKQEEAWRSQREKKGVKQYLPELVWAEKRTWGAIILDGEGTPLGSITSVNRAIDTLKNDDPILKKLHSLMFGCPGQKVSVKKNLRQYNGIPLNEQHLWMEQMRAKLSRMQLHKEIKPICKTLDLEPSTDVALAIQRILNFLMKPRASDHSPKKTTSAKKSSTPKREATQDDGTSKPKRISGFLYFASANRERVKEKHPEFTFGEIGKYMGKAWNKLDAEEKASWLVKAQQNAESGSPKPAKSLEVKKSGTPKVRKPRKPKMTQAAESSDEEDGDETEEEQGGPSWATVQAKIAEIMKAGDLDTLSIKKIKEELSALFGATYVSNNGSQIKDYITKRVSEEA